MGLFNDIWNKIKNPGHAPGRQGGETGQAMGYQKPVQRPAAPHKPYNNGYIGETAQAVGYLNNSGASGTSSKKPLNPNTSASSSGGGYSGGGGGGYGGGYGGGSSSVSIPAAPEAPKWEKFNPNWDNIKVYNPNFDKFSEMQKGILDGYGQQRSAYQQTAKTAETEFEQQLQNLLKRSGKQRDANIRNFADARGQINKETFDAQRQMRENMASRGLGNSGLSQLADMQTRMAASDGISRQAEQYYQAAEGLADQEAEAEQRTALGKQKVRDSLGEQMAQLLQAENMSKSQYESQMDALRRQVQADTNALENSKNEWGYRSQNDANQAEQARAAWEQTMRDFAMRQQNADRDFGLRQQQMAQAAAASAASNALARDRFNAEQQARTQANNPLTWQLKEFAQAKDMSVDDFQTYLNETGNTANTANDYYANWGWLDNKDSKKSKWKFW